MNAFEILLIVLLTLIFVAVCGTVFALLYKLKVQRTKDMTMSHRELWLYYMDNEDLRGILSNNNGRKAGEIISPNELTEKEYRFLVLFLNHMEFMLPSWKRFEADWHGLFQNKCLQMVYQNTRSYRGKKFCKLIDKIIASYEK